MGDGSDGRGRSEEYSDSDIIRVLSSGDRFSTEEVAKELGCHQSTANRRLKKLKEKGWVKSEKVGRSNIWKTDKEPSFYLVPVEQYPKIYREGVINSIKINRDIPSSIIPEEIRDLEKTKAWPLSPENNDIFNKVVYGDYLLFYYQYQKPVKISGSKGTITGIAKVSKKIENQKVSDYLWPEIIGNKNIKLPYIFLFDVKPNSQIFNNSFEFKELLIPDIFIDDVLKINNISEINLSSLKKPVKLESEKLEKYLSGRRGFMNLYRSNFRWNLREITSNFIDSGIIEGDLEKDVEVGKESLSNEVDEIDLEVLSQSDRRKRSFGRYNEYKIDLVYDTGEADWVVEATNWISPKHLGIITFLAELYKEEKILDKVKKAIISGPPTTPLEEYKLGLLEPLFNKYDIQLFIQGREFN
ncbi:MAG: winged helix-turn-helix transcriptional regulator [Halobacteria archaeon]